MRQDVKHIMVAGGGTAGYLTVYYLLQKLPHLRITWIFPEDNNPIGVGEATIPYVQAFLKDLGIDLSTIISECNGSIKLGLKFEGFYKDGETFFHPFSHFPKDAVKNTLLMEHNMIDDDMLDDKENYAVHFDLQTIIPYLHEKIITYDQIHIVRDIVRDIQHDSDRNIQSINGIEADMFVDCTGFGRRVIGTVHDDNFIDSTPIIPNNKALVYRSKYTDLASQLKNYTSCKAMKYGWCWNIPLGDTLSVGYVYDDAYEVQEEFTTYLKGLFGEVDESKILTIPIKTGRNKFHFHNNVASVGLSSCFIEPLESTGLYFTMKNISLIGRYLTGEIDQAYFNECVNKDYDDILNFIVLHYKFSSLDNDYWNHYKELDIRSFHMNGVFRIESWYAILAGNYKADLIQEYFGKGAHLERQLLQKGFNQEKYLQDKKGYIDWLDSVKYRHWISVDSVS